MVYSVATTLFTQKGKMWIQPSVIGEEEMHDNHETMVHVYPSPLADVINYFSIAMLY